MIRRQDSNTGQLLILGALSFAILLLSLSFVLNTLIYTENASVRGVNIAEYSPQKFSSEAQSVHRSHLGELAQETGESYSSLENQLNRYLEISTEVLEEDLSRRGVLTNITTVENQYGTAAYQLESDSFTNRNGSGNWQLIQSSANYQAFKFAIEKETLPEIEYPVEVEDDNPFTFRTNEESLFVYKKENGNIVIERHEGGELEESCIVNESDGEYASIDFTTQTVEEVFCTPLSTVSNADSVTITNPNEEVSGQFSILASKPVSEFVNESQYYSDTSEETPQVSPIIYSSTVEIQYTDVNTNLTQEQEVKIRDIYDIGD